MAKFKVKLELALLTVLELIALAHLVVTRMTGNAEFTTPDPALNDLATAADDLEAAKLKVDEAKNKLAQAVSEQSTAQNALKELLTLEAAYVELKSRGVKEVIESAGMKVQDEAAPVGEMPKVENLNLSSGDGSGEIDAHWNSVAKRKNYTVQVTPDPIVAANWVTVGNPTKSSFTITGLTTANKMWVRVCANATDGAGAFSDPAFIVVP